MTVASVCDEDQREMDGHPQTAEVGEAHALMDFDVDVGAGPRSSRIRRCMILAVISKLPASMLATTQSCPPMVGPSRHLRKLFLIAMSHFICLAQIACAETPSLPTGDSYFQLRNGLANSRATFEREKFGRVVFLGGSITQSSGWRELVMDYLQKKFPDTKFEFITAGIGSLGSVPHAFRLESDVLSSGPVDLLFVEAAVNDTGNTSDFPERMLRGMEGVVRHARTVNPSTDIIHLHFVMPEHMADYNAGRVPVSIAMHEKVAEAYGNPSLNLAKEVTDRIKAGEFTWADDFRNLHPAPFGHELYARSIQRMLEAAWSGPAGNPAPHKIPESPVDAASYDRGRFGKLEDIKLIEGFRLVSRWTPEVPAKTRPGFVDVPALVAAQPGAEFKFDFDGTAAGLLIGSGPDSGILEVSCDGGPFQKIDTFTNWSRELYLPGAVILAENLQPGRHVVRVRLAKEHKSKGTALYVFRLLLN
jgi:sialidase-1